MTTRGLGFHRFFERDDPAPFIEFAAGRGLRGLGLFSSTALLVVWYGIRAAAPYLLLSAVIAVLGVGPRNCGGPPMPANAGVDRATMTAPTSRLRRNLWRVRSLVCVYDDMTSRASRSTHLRETLGP